MAPPDPRLRSAVTQLVARRARRSEGLFVAGLCGAQGSGKSTLAAAVAQDLAAVGLPTAVLSVDDLYLTHAKRLDLAAAVHPLLRTRGVPGTHDLALAGTVIAALERGEAAALPRFDKAADDRLPPGRWDRAPQGTRVLILEGWCVGAAPQDAADLAEPVNALERDEDPDGTWRRHVNTCLAGPYQALFARLDFLVLLAAPGFENVAGWRWEQERDRQGGAMDRAAIVRFVAHYERLTRHILAEMPARADLVARMGPDRALLALESPASPETKR